MQGLKNIRVVDFTSRIAGPYATKLLADAGADVIKVESPTGDPLRRWSSTGAAIPEGEDSAFFQYLNASKRSVVGYPSDPEIRELIRSADLVLEDFETGSDEYRDLDIAGLRDEQPDLVVLSLSPFGRTGPYAMRVATEFTVQAESGSVALRGVASEKPYMAGGRATDYVGGTYAAATAIAAVRGAQQGGSGQHIDFSLTEVMHTASTIYFDLMFSILGRPDMPGPLRTVESPSIEPTKDGWVGFTTNSRQQFDDFLIMIERGDLLGDEELASNWTRQNRMEEWTAIVREWTTQRTTEEIIELAAMFRIPVAPVCNGKTVLENKHFQERGVFEKSPSGQFMQPRPPYKIDGQRIRMPTPAPRLGEHTGKIEARSPTERKATINKGDLPLKGLRVLDATAWWAGPIATQLLAALGADVIHLESSHRYDGARNVVAIPSGDRWWESGHLFNGTNTNKRDLTLELNKPEGMELFKKLVKKCDIVVENYSPRVFENFGLDWDCIHELNPEALFVRMPAFGLDGPWRDYVGFAQTMEQMTGMAWMTGRLEDQPRTQRGPCDPLAGMHAAFAMLVGLAEREASGTGHQLECTMVEGALNIAAEQVVEYTAYGNIMERDGNRSPFAAPQGVYACQGEENWLALSIENDKQWQALVGVLGCPDWATDDALKTHEGRRAAHDLIDQQLDEWSQNQNLDDIVEKLLAAGVPAATLLDTRHGYLHPQMQARGYFERVEHPVIGTHPIAGMPFRFADKSDARWNRSYAPTLGQHNHEILRDLIGLSEGEIQSLEEKTVIGTLPENLA